MAAPLSFPREIGRENGVRIFSLSEEHYRNAGPLMDLMMRDEDICRTGCFMGRLEDSVKPSNEDTLENIRIVKDTLRKDAINPETGRAYFDPTLQMRGHIRPEKNVYRVVMCDSEETDKRHARSLRRRFKERVLNHDFMDRREENKTELEKIYDESGIDGALNSLFESLKKPDHMMMYATNITLQESLKTTDHLSMEEMQSFIKHLPGEPCAGITSPAVFIGQETTTFNPHIEDCAFQAVNRHIAGSIKPWFFIPPMFYSTFCRLIAKMGLSPDERSCQYFINHNAIFLDPRTVVQYGIPVFSVVQKPGDVLYLLPHTVHWGFNLGLNLNEEMNIASASWAKSGMVAPTRCNCISADEEDNSPFDLVPLLEEIGVDAGTIQDYKKNWLVDCFGVEDILHPEHGAPGTAIIKMENLLGPLFKDFEIGKRWNVSSAVPHEGGQTAVLWGRHEDVIQLNDSDEEEEEKEDHDDDRQGDPQGGRELKCPKPSCSQTYRGGVLKRLRSHIAKAHADDPHLEQYQMAVDDARPNKIPKKECERCGKKIAGRAAQMRIHQNSRNCQERDGVL